MTTIRHLYFHIPFCHQICPYCSFYKHQPGDLANGAFVRALLSELRRRGVEVELKPETIYFGGGTPTLLSRKHLEELLTGIAEGVDLSELKEWTLEANPATFGEAKAKMIRDCGVTRVSLGVQSWQPDLLETLGRDHSPEGAAEAYHVLRSAGFPSVNVDLMFSVPGQTLERWADDVVKTLTLQPDHVSAYNLTYEEDTEYFARFLKDEYREDEDTNADLFYHALDRLEAAGYRHYEISNYARPGHESLHNQAYWAGEDYVGIGPGAVSTIGFERSTNVPDTARYVAGQLGEDDVRVDGKLSPALVATEMLTEEDKRIEAIGLQIRRARGLEVALLSKEALRQADILTEQQLLRQSNGHLVLTREGKALADPIAGQLL